MKRKPDTAPKFPALRKKCKYCKLEFTTPATANGQKMEFCKPTHRWAYAREGSKPIDAIMRKYEKRMREIAREEADARYERLKVYVMDTLSTALAEIHIRTVPSPAVHSESQRSV